ncbi:MAG: hypothetical protein QE271_13525 [Bacteriovoracaceae bacterium]|nr:hypothetical protein [Bacteriovoracaceae bacterium]
MNRLNLLGSNSPFLESFLNKCDWYKLISQVTKYAHFDTTKKELELPPSHQSTTQLHTQFNELGFFYEKILQLGSQIYQTPLQKVSSTFPFQETGPRIEKEAWFSLGEIHQIVTTIEVWSELRQHCPPYWFPVEFQETFQLLRKQLVLSIREFIAADGMIQYHLHPLLKPKYKSLMDCDERAKKLFQQVLFHHPQKDKWQGSTADVINDKYVILVKTDSFDHALGSIVRRSESGFSLYVELHEFKEFSRKREQLQQEIEQILYQLAWQYSQVMHKHAYAIVRIQAQLRVIDGVKAKAIRSLEGNWKRPLLSDFPGIKIEGLRHPLIEGAVKNDVYLSKEKPTLIISGPNTGGKTVTLKAISLIHLMVAKGLFIPVDDASIYPFQNIIYFSGDDQDISKGLSSFASEMELYGEMLENLQTDNLIFIDEILKSTSSEEASAIAWGILSTLNKFPNTFTFLSTHHNSLKVFAHQSTEFASAHMGFLGTEKRPTYKLHFGQPGSSFALEIAEHIAKKHPPLHKVLSLASKQLEGQQIKYEQLLQSLITEKSTQEKYFQEQKTKIDQTTKELRSEKESMKLRFQKEMDDWKSELARIKNEAISWVKENSTPTKTVLRKIENQVSDFVVQAEIYSEMVKEQFPALSAPSNNSQQNSSKELQETDEWQAGKQYFCDQFNQKVTLLEILGTGKNAQGLIALGSMRTRVPLQTLKLSDPSLNQNKSNKSFHFTIETNKELEIKHDCRGMRLSDFENLIQDLCGHIMAKNLPYAEIIHGHGDGILKNWLRSFLKKQGDLEGIVDLQKSDGVTTIQFKKI